MNKKIITNGKIYENEEFLQLHDNGDLSPNAVTIMIAHLEDPALAPRTSKIEETDEGVLITYNNGTTDLIGLNEAGTYLPGLSS